MRKHKTKIIHSKNGDRKITMERKKKAGFGKWQITKNEPA